MIEILKSMWEKQMCKDDQENSENRKGKLALWATKCGNRSSIIILQFAPMSRGVISMWKSRRDSDMKGI